MASPCSTILTAVHDDDVVRDIADRLDVMADEHHGKVELLLQIHQQVEDLGAHGHVECRGGLVGDDGVGFQGQRTGDCHALTLAAGRWPGSASRTELGRTTISMSSRTRASRDFASPTLCTIMGSMQLLADGHARVQGRCRVLEHDGDDAADDLALRCGALRDIGALEVHMTGRGGLQTAHDVGRGGLAAAGLADDADGLAGHELQGQAVDGVDLVGVQQASRYAVLKATWTSSRKMIGVCSSLLATAALSVASAHLASHLRVR